MLTNFSLLCFSNIRIRIFSLCSFACTFLCGCSADADILYNTENNYNILICRNKSVTFFFYKEISLISFISIFLEDEFLSNASWHRGQKVFEHIHTYIYLSIYILFYRLSFGLFGYKKMLQLFFYHLYVGRRP